MQRECFMKKFNHRGDGVKCTECWSSNKKVALNRTTFKFLFLLITYDFPPYLPV